MMIACKLEKKGNGVILGSTLTPDAGEGDFNTGPLRFTIKFSIPRKFRTEGFESRISSGELASRSYTNACYHVALLDSGNKFRRFRPITPLAALGTT